MAAEPRHDRGIDGRQRREHEFASAQQYLRFYAASRREGWPRRHRHRGARCRLTLTALSGHWDHGISATFLSQSTGSKGNGYIAA